MNGRVMIVDDDAELCRLLATGLTRRGFEASWQTSATAALGALETSEVDAVVADVSMPEVNGLELCERIAANRPHVPVTLLTGFGNLDVAVAAIRAGAYDLLLKPPDLDVVAAALERAVRHGRVSHVIKQLPWTVAEDDGRTEIIGTSLPMRKLFDLVAQVVDSHAAVLVSGESGTGKELVARALHRRGKRAEGPFVAVNCAAVPEALLESELFGHVRGAFTDARADRLGLFARANAGTLFLDEIADLPLALQPKLLRVLQERAVRPVGGDVEQPCDVRVVAATNHDLEAAVAAGRFREDLYFRINVIRIEVPPLRARGDDILLLAQHFLRRSAAQAGKPVRGLSPAAAERLVTYPWPGNVRELENCIERAVILARHEEIVVDDLPERIQKALWPPLALPTSEPVLALAEVERRHILRVLDAVNGNRTRAATLLGLHRRTLSRKLHAYRHADPVGRTAACGTTPRAAARR
ncbi:MAG TPA: sigma-54 dependent transcriptional regulator [Candidatus Binatia bacterium]|nr:sigma-54 dependent transcriptional regulator [Candidatus Binatia bacterium]